MASASGSRPARPASPPGDMDVDPDGPLSPMGMSASLEDEHVEEEDGSEAERSDLARGESDADSGRLEETDGEGEDAGQTGYGGGGDTVRCL
jgi:hypothetical protein